MGYEQKQLKINQFDAKERIEKLMSNQHLKRALDVVGGNSASGKILLGISHLPEQEQSQLALRFEEVMNLMILAWSRNWSLDGQIHNFYEWMSKRWTFFAGRADRQKWNYLVSVLDKHYTTRNNAAQFADSKLIFIEEKYAA